MNETLNEKFHLLKPVQQEFITFCVQKYTNIEGFHRGLLPFLKTKIAIRALKYRMDSEAYPSNIVADSNGSIDNGRFIRNLLSLISDGEWALLYSNEAAAIPTSSVTLYLKTDKVLKKFRMQRSNHPTRFTAHSWALYPKLADFEYDFKMEFLLVRKNHWQITAPAFYLDRISTGLAETLR